MARRLSLLMEDEREEAGAAGSAGDDPAGRDVRLLSDVAEAFGDFGGGVGAGLLDQLMESGLAGRSEAVCELGVAVVSGLDSLRACGQAECFRALDLAARLFKRAVEEDAACAEAYRLLAVSYLLLGREREAVDVTRGWESAFGDEGQPGFRDVLVVRGVAQVFGGRATEAAFTFSRAMKLFPGSGEARFGMGLAYLALSKGEECAGEIVELSRQDAGLADVLAGLSRLGGVTFGDVVSGLRGVEGASRVLKLLSVAGVR